MSSFTKFIKSIQDKITPNLTHTIKESQLKKLKQIGSGNFGTVYSAVWNDKRVAVKVFSNSLDNLEALRNYKVEVDKTTKLEHKNVVFFYGETQIKRKNAFVMELADCSLDKIIHRDRDWYSFKEAFRWLLDVAEGVSYMHRNRIIHRDLKPANLLVFNFEDKSLLIIKIADFGISREKHTTESTKTAEVGTPAYMAPEVVQGSKYDQRCDVYSFGIIVWEVFSKQKPFAGMSNIQILFAVGNGKPPNVESVNCPEDVRILMKKCWEKDWEKRMEMDKVLTMLESVSVSCDSGICSLNQHLQEIVTRSSLDKWLLLSRLSADLKNRIRLAAVEKTINDFEAIVITEDDETFYVRAVKDSNNSKNEIKPIKIDELSGLGIKNLIYRGKFLLDAIASPCLYVLTNDSKLSMSYDMKDQVFVLIDKTVVQVAGSKYYALALTSDGEVFARGDNSYGQLGNRTTNRLDEFARVTAEIGCRRTITVACCSCTSFALMDNGDVFAWGDNSYGKLGLGNDTNFKVLEPKRIKTLAGIKIRRLACGLFHVLAVADDGSMFAWGENTIGQLGTGDTKDRHKPVKIESSGVKFIEAAACNYLSVALSEDGRCWVWGMCKTGEGPFDFEDVLFPKPVDSTLINDAIAQYAVGPTTWKTMAIK